MTVEEEIAWHHQQHAHALALLNAPWTASVNEYFETIPESYRTELVVRAKQVRERQLIAETKVERITPWLHSMKDKLAWLEKYVFGPLPPGEL